MSSSRWLINGLEEVDAVFGEGEAGEGGVGRVGGLSAEDVGQVLGTAMPAVRKKSEGEAKESNDAPGSRNSLSLRVYNIFESQVPFSRNSDSGSKGVSVRVDGFRRGGGVVAMPVQS